MKEAETIRGYHLKGKKGLNHWGARLVRGSSGTETPGRHPAAIVARVSPDSPARLSVHLVLPAVPGLGRQAGPGHAPGASGR